MQPQSLLVLTAVEMEARAVKAAFGASPPSDAQVHIHAVGIGAGCLPTIERGQIAIIIMAGLGGALDPALQIGDIVVDCDVELPQIESPMRRGRIYAMDRIVATPGEKAELHRQTGALTVDMEGAIVRKWAQEVGARFIGIRAISDRADQTLDPAVLALVDQRGRPKWRRIAGTLLQRPSLLPHLIRLGRDSRRATRTLGAAVKVLVDHLLKSGGTSP